MIMSFSQAVKAVTPIAKVNARHFKTSGRFPIISQEAALISGFWDREEDAMHFERPVVVFGDHTRNVKFVDFDFVAGADGVKILQPIDELEPKYLYYWLLANPISSLGYSRHYRLLKEKSINIPSRDIQLQIIRKLDKSFEKINHAIELTQRSNKLAYDLLQASFDEYFKRYNNQYKISKLEEITSLITRGISPKYTEGDGVSILNQRCIRDHKILVENARKHDIQIKKVAPAKFIKTGDVLVNSTGQGTLGRSATVNSDYDGFLCDSHVTIVRPKDHLFIPGYFAFLMETFETRFVEMATGTSGQTELPREGLKKLEVSYSEEKEFQSKVVAHLTATRSKINKLSNAYEHKITNLLALKQSQLNQAFTERMMS